MRTWALGSVAYTLGAVARSLRPTKRGPLHQLRATIAAPLILWAVALAERAGLPPSHLNPHRRRG